jgi:hypothetical protein
MDAARFIFLEEWAYAGKTQVWAVRSHRSGDVLGEIRWYGPWRQYAFFPRVATIYNPDCLDLISRWTREKTTAHRRAKASA